MSYIRMLAVILIMKRGVSIIILTWTVALTLLACRDKEIIKSKNYSFEVKTWGFPGTKSFEAFMYNTDLRTYPPDRRGGIQFKENTLYVLKHEYLDNQRTTDTLKIELTGEQVDSLYNLAYRYLSSFEIDNEVEIGKVYESIQDGASISVTLGYNGKLMQWAQYRLKGVTYASVGGDKLVKFINDKAPEKFRLY
jgi:hypothetical protein